MSGLLRLDRLASGRGDGLLPQFRSLLEARASALAPGSGLHEFPAAANQAGPNPRGGKPAELPGNVVVFTPRGR